MCKRRNREIQNLNQPRNTITPLQVTITVVVDYDSWHSPIRQYESQSVPRGRSKRPRDEDEEEEDEDEEVGRKKSPKNPLPPGHCNPQSNLGWYNIIYSNEPRILARSLLLGDFGFGNGHNHPLSWRSTTVRRSRT